jgi:hypothetical protein
MSVDARLSRYAREYMMGDGDEFGLRSLFADKWFGHSTRSTGRLESVQQSKAVYIGGRRVIVMLLKIVDKDEPKPYVIQFREGGSIRSREQFKSLIEAREVYKSVKSTDK